MIDQVDQLRLTTAQPYRNTRTETILVVEDDDRILRLVAGVLRARGYRVIEAADPSDALRICVEDNPDLLLTDIVMPAMNGRELAERAAELQPRLRILYMSGYPDDVIGRASALLTPDTPFLPKPFTPDALARKVREVLG